MQERACRMSAAARAYGMQLLPDPPTAEEERLHAEAARLRAETQLLLAETDATIARTPPGFCGLSKVSGRFDELPADEAMLRARTALIEARTMLTLAQADLAISRLPEGTPNATPHTWRLPGS